MSRKLNTKSYLITKYLLVILFNVMLLLLPFFAVKGQVENADLKKFIIINSGENTRFEQWLGSKMSQK